MSKTKYIVEIDEECDVIQQICVKENGTVWTDDSYVSNLEELNYDYINEHFSDLQDTAYQKGFEDGKNSIDNGCKGCKYEDQHGYDEPCNKCLHAHASHYTPMPKQDDPIKVGDEVINNTTGTKGILLEPETEDLLATVVVPNNRWNTFNISHTNLTKTGRHFDIEGILEAMKNG